MNLASLDSSGLDNTRSYSWLIATATDGISGTPTLGTITGTDFVAYDSLPGHSFSLNVSGDNLYLIATPVPEPFGILVGVSCIYALRRLRRDFTTSDP